MSTRRDIIKIATTSAGLATTVGLSSALSGCGAFGPKRTAVVVGAGIAGLSAAYELLEGGFDVSVMEKWDFVGGRMRNAQMGPINTVPHAIGVLKANREMFDLARKIGIHDQLDGTQESDAYMIDNGHGSYLSALRYNSGRIARIPGLSKELIAKLPLLQPDVDLIKAEVNPCLGATGASYDNESIEEYYFRVLGRQVGTEFLNNYMDPVLAAWGWRRNDTSRMAIQPYIYQGVPTVVPNGGIGVLTRKLAELVTVQTQTSVRYITPPDSSGRHTIHYLNKDLQELSVTPDVVVVATEGKFIPEIVQGLDQQQTAFFRGIDFTKGCGVQYILPPDLAPKKPESMGYTPSHPDPMKRRINFWMLAPAGFEHPDNPPVAIIYVSREEAIRWQGSNRSQPDYCLPFLKYVLPDLDTSKISDAVTMGCDDLMQMPTGYVRSMATILKKQETGRKGLYFAGEYMAGAHTGAACASGRSVAANILSHWA